MRTLLSKAYHTVRNEGVGSFVGRTARYSAYKYKRLRMDKSETLAEWAALRGAYAGERAFLIGNGPSLNRTPLYLLGDEYTMAFNRFDLMLERIGWIPSFYSVADDRVLEDIIDTANDMSRIVDHAFFPDIHPYNVDFRDRIIKRPNVHWLHLDSTRFSASLPSCGINKTVANVGLQILAHLGFTEIYLIGLDMDYGIPAASKIENARDITGTEDNDDNHFDPRYFGRGRKYHVPMLDETFVKFREARQFLESRGITVFNATKGGKLEEFRRVEFETVLGFDHDRQIQLYVANIRSRLEHDNRLDVAEALRLPAAKLDSGLEAGTRVFRAPVEDVQSWIGRTIHDYVPFGPVDESYLFIRRDQIRSTL